ncbi:hypothetical protein [Kytococcus sedentarius]|uniref:hypothetical protein n=1 Tax=Kytococcus sedentarius TaxID=1276 RepID=UPI00066100C2|nr:hypothetical protein [Kytococcus sedentarius]
MNSLLLGLQSDPFVTTVVVGLIWPIVQAALDKPWWTRGRRVALLAIVAAIVTAAVWVSGSYPATWQLLTSQLTVFLGTAWSVYQVLAAVKINGVNLLDWVGAVTPGGQAVSDLTGAPQREDAWES